LKIGTMDELAVKENHEIENLLNNIQDRIRSGRRNKQDTTRLEEDLCYVQREYDIRVQRVRWLEKRGLK
jgi:hypothetical protein